MRFLPRFAIILALSFSCGLLTATSQTKAPKKPLTNNVSGRVTLQGKPAAGIVVGVRSSDFPQQNQAYRDTTDQEGNYQITGIPAGNYTVAPMAPALVNPEILYPRERQKTLLLGEGEDVKDIDFSLVRGAVITGKVTDADGRPVVEERVLVVLESQTEQRPWFYSGGTFFTDDRGIYRIYGLPAGRYRVSVGLSQSGFSAPIRPGRITYRQTFYPDVSEPSAAKIIELTEGSEASNIDITVGRNLPTFTASGKIIDGETGKPVAGVRFSLRRMLNERDVGPMTGQYIASSNLGEFRIENVTPGKYAVSLSQQEQSQSRADPVFFEIVDHDVTDLLVKTLRGYSISGNLVLNDSYDRSVFAKLSELKLRAYVRTETPNFGYSRESVISADGSFRIGGLAPGTANFSLGGAERGVSTRFTIIRVERDGVDQPRGIEIKEGEDVAGVRVFVSYGTGSLRGEVKIVNGPLPSGAYITVWLKKPGDSNGRFRPYGLDSRGHFVIDAVALGEYELNVAANAPGARRSIATAKQMVNISDGVNSVEIVLDLKQVPLP